MFPRPSPFPSQPAAHLLKRDAPGCHQRRPSSPSHEGPLLAGRGYRHDARVLDAVADPSPGLVRIVISVDRERDVDDQHQKHQEARGRGISCGRGDGSSPRNLVDPAEGRITLTEWSGEWLNVAGADLKPKTLQSYRSLLDSRILPTFGPCAISSIRPGDVDAWVASLRRDRLSPSRIRQAHVVLSAMLELAMRHDRIPRNVARGADLPPIRRKEAPYFDPATVDRIIAATPSECQPFIAVQGILGLRFGEAAALRRRSIDLLRRRVRVSESLAEVSGALSFGSTKTHAHRAIPFPTSLRTRLEEHLEAHVEPVAEALLFTSSRGYPLRYSRFRPTVWVPTLERLGLPAVGLHALRHSAAARMIGAGWQPKAVQQALGHAWAAFTLTVYGHLFDADMDALGDALDSTQADARGGHLADGAWGRT